MASYGVNFFRTKSEQPIGYFFLVKSADKVFIKRGDPRAYSAPARFPPDPVAHLIEDQTRRQAIAQAKPAANDQAIKSSPINDLIQSSCIDDQAPPPSCACVIRPRTAGGSPQVNRS
jgi:hypothetical protein